MTNRQLVSEQAWFNICPLVPLPRTRRQLAQASLAEVAVDFDAWNAVPRQIKQFINGDKAPLIEGKARDISESNTLFWIVLGDVPSARSGDIKKLCQDARIFLAILGVQWITSGKLRELDEKLVFGHKSDS